MTDEDLRAVSEALRSNARFEDFTAWMVGILAIALIIILYKRG